MVAKKSESDDSVKFLEFDTNNWMADFEANQWDYDVDDINEKLVSKYNFPDAGKHNKFLKDAIKIILTYPRIQMRDDVVIVPSGLKEFKKSGAQFRQLINKIDDVSELLFALRCDATSDMLMNYFDQEEYLKCLTESLGPALGVLAEIDKLKGTVGGRPTGEWATQFCVHCQKFWSEEIGGGTRIIFEGARATHITGWLEEVFEELRIRIGINTPISQIKTVARDIPAYRHSTQPIVGDTP